MVGSQDSISAPNVILNTIVAEAFAEVCDELEKAEDFNATVHDIIKRQATEHQRIIFNGNGYSDEWVAEAERRGLPNIKSMVDAIPALTTEKSVALFEKFGVFTRAELESRAEILYETYAKEINIEARAMINIASKTLIPSVIKYITSLATSINAVKAACDCDISVQTELLEESSDLLSEAKVALSKLEEVTDAGLAMADGKERAEYYRDVVKVAMEALRTPIDKLEIIVAKEMWPMPSYGDLIFEV
jgi:glutamine synthetase